MKVREGFCEVYLNNQRYVFDDRRQLFRASLGLGARAVTMEQVRADLVHTALAPAYVIVGVPYCYDERRDELARVLEPDKRVGAGDYRALLEMGAVSAPTGDAYKAIVDREAARLRETERER